MRIKQVLFNLLGNAIKFTERGEVGVRIESPASGAIRFTVHDTGPGLAPGQQARIFGRFEQGDGPRTGARYGGSGLGLAITQEIVSAMGGSIRVASAPGEGARFVVELPLAVTPECRSVGQRALVACTASTSTATCAGSMSGDMPWPRLNTCPSGEPPLPAA